VRGNIAGSNTGLCLRISDQCVLGFPTSAGEGVAVQLTCAKIFRQSESQCPTVRPARATYSPSRLRCACFGGHRTSQRVRGIYPTVPHSKAVSLRGSQRLCLRSQLHRSNRQSRSSPSLLGRSVRHEDYISVRPQLKQRSRLSFHTQISQIVTISPACDVRALR
jgi:hypothetical protein